MFAPYIGPGIFESVPRDAGQCRATPAPTPAAAARVGAPLGPMPTGLPAPLLARAPARPGVQADLIEFERRLLELREQVLTGRTPPPTRAVTLDEFVGPWFEKLAMQVELGRISPLTFNKYEGDWRRHLKPAFGRLPLAAIDQERLVRYMRAKMQSGLSESTSRAGSSRCAGCSPTPSATATSSRTRSAHRSAPGTAAAVGTTSSTSRSSASRRSTSK